MKKYFFGLFSLAFLVACGDHKANTNTGDSGPNSTNVQNVNGNQPDTSSGITLSNKQSTDTTKKDSVPH